MALTTTAPATPKLQAIATDEPVYVSEVGQRLEGLLWIVEPENFDTLIDMVNTYGGPTAYRITPLSQLEEDQLYRIQSERPEMLEYVLSFKQ